MAETPFLPPLEINRRVFLSLLALAAVGCQSPLPTPPADVSTPSLASPVKLSREPGRVVVTGAGGTAVWRISSNGTAHKLHDLPADFRAVISRTGQGPRLCTFVPLSEPGMENAVQTIELQPDGSVSALPDRPLPEGASPLLHLPETDTVVATVPGYAGARAKLLVLDSQGKVSTLTTSIEGELRVSGCDGQRLAVVGYHLTPGSNEMVAGPLQLFDISSNRAKPLALLKVAEIFGKSAAKAHVTGLSFLRQNGQIYLTAGLDVASGKSAVLIYRLDKGGLTLAQRLDSEPRPGPLLASGPLASFQQDGEGAVHTYRLSGSKWQPADQVVLESGAPTPQSDNPRGLAFLQNASGEVWCASIDDQAKLSPLLAIPQLTAQPDQTAQRVRLVLD